MAMIRISISCCYRNWRGLIQDKLREIQETKKKKEDDEGQLPRRLDLETKPVDRIGVDLDLGKGGRDDRRHPATEEGQTVTGQGRERENGDHRGLGLKRGIVNRKNGGSNQDPETDRKENVTGRGLPS